MEEKDFVKRRRLILVYLTGLFFIVTFIIGVWYLWLIGFVVFILVLRQYRQFIEKEFPLQSNVGNEQPGVEKTHSWLDELGNLGAFFTGNKYVKIFSYLLGVGTMAYFFYSENAIPLIWSLIFIILVHREYWPTYKKKEPRQFTHRKVSVTGQEKICPFCAETIKAEAIVCRYCGRDLDPKTAFWRSPAGTVIGIISLLIVIFFVLNICRTLYNPWWW